MKSFSLVQLSFILLVVGCCLSVYARSNGAPEQACKDMKPQHGVDWQMNVSPFEIIVDKSIYKGNSLNIKLGIKSDVAADDANPYSRGFKGFMIMVFDGTGFDIEPMGVFGDLASTVGKTMDCPDPVRNARKLKVAVTHANSDFKKSVEVVWTPPADYLGAVVVTATFVHEKNITWVRETSIAVAVLPEPMEESTTVTTPTTTTTTPNPTTTTTTPTTTTIAPTTPAAAGRLSVTTWTTLFGVAVMSFYVFHRL